MVKPSNEVLEERMCNMEKTNNKEHSEIKDMLIEMSKKIEKLPESFVTRMEFKAASAVLGVLSVVIGLVVFFSSKP